MLCTVPESILIPGRRTVALLPDIVMELMLSFVHATELAVLTVKLDCTSATSSPEARLTGVAASLAVMESFILVGIGYRPPARVKYEELGYTVPPLRSS